MFLFLTAIITFFVLLILSSAVFDLLPKAISNNKSIFNIVTIVVTSLIVVPPMIWMYRNFDTLYHPIGEINHWQNLDNVGNFIFLWSLVILFTYIFSNVLKFLIKILRINFNEEQKTKVFYIRFIFY
ncbi:MULTISPECIES: hypothetical protein [Nostoc]|uniref:hypothetical protein n=1 Tax=Nostoc TaxID=1177 RepID=UPI001684A7E6|nr:MULTISPECIES: hypothetical protein [Nostoc]